MEKEAFRWWLTLRTRDLNTGLAVYFIATALVAGILILGSDAITQASLQLAFIVVTVGFTIVSWLWIDGAIADLGNGKKDMPEDEKNSALGQSFLKAPFAFFRAIITIIMLAIAASLVYGVTTI